MKTTETVRANPSPAVSERMKRKADSIACTYGAELFTLGWIAGLLSAFSGYAVPACLIGAAAAAVWLVTARLRKRSMRYLLIAAGLLLGAAVWQGYDCRIRQPLLALDGTSQVCTGTVTRVHQLTGGRMQYTLNTKLIGHRVTIDWYADAKTPQQQVGDAVTLKADLTRIQPDYRYHTAAYQAGMGRYLRIYKADLLDSQPETGFSLRRIVLAYREHMTAAIRTTLSPDDAGLLCAMLFGDKTLLSEETVLGLNRTGIGHIAVVSGLHLVLFCTVIGWLLKRVSCPAKIAFLLQIIAIMLFMLLVDGSVSVLRAACMVLLARSAPLFGRHSDTLRALCLAAIGCTLFTPYVIGSVSFWLSVSGVLGIGVIAPYMTKHLKCSAFCRTFLQLCCVAVTVFPASVLLCGESSLLTPVCNLLILPVCTAALYLGFAFLLTGGLLSFLLPAAGILCRFARMLTQFAAELPFSHLTVNAPAMRDILVLCTGILALLAICRAKPKTLGIAAACAAVMLMLEHLLLLYLAEDQLKIALLGGKQTGALVISTAHQTVVCDLTDTPRNAQYVQRFLRDAGVTHADALLLQSDRSAAAYQSELTGVTCGAVLLRADSHLHDGTTVFGKTPLQNVSGEVTFRCGDAEIIADGSGLRIIWHGMSVTAAEALPEQERTCTAAIRYGKEGFAVTLNRRRDDAAPIRFSENNLLLTLTKDGLGSLEPLT